ncbi:amino acid ABC transporter ATP-binding protein [Treponema sp.]|uniref:amino acid ABC transporter ATP-binding protein n=1 Tax=Treponema sp. TaxID=166 RepID=UPI0025F4C83E|nr:amino acid ABC transporter ATP-binding protein [Treponema sp.]MCR5217901.1 amino acid ABC transporter ATP-binding protein [Treponema sp.]
MGYVLETKDIRKTIEGKTILDGVSLSVKEGEVLVILGPSGSGKTTFLRTLNFLNPADGGTISIDGVTVDAASYSGKDVLKLRRKTGMVFQNYNLFQNRTVLQNITDGMTVVQKIKKDVAKEKALKLLEKVNLLDKADSYPCQLSGGQQQRVGICRALALEPKVILFDEPTSALDPELVGGVLATMRDVAASGITMIVVTHEIRFAKDVADTVVYMEDGKIVESGSPKEVLDKPEDQRTIRFLRSLLNDYSEYYI